MAREPDTGFELVFRRHFRDIYGYVAFRLAPQIDDAQDLTQDIFLAGLESWDSFRGETTPLQWLRAIARRKVADFFAHKRTDVSIESLLSSITAPVDGDPRRQAEMLAAAMRLIPPESADLLEQKYLDGLSIREIASRRGKTEKAVESALTRARALFRERSLHLQAQLRHST